MQSPNADCGKKKDEDKRGGSADVLTQGELVGFAAQKKILKDGEAIIYNVYDGREEDATCLHIDIAKNDACNGSKGNLCRITMDDTEGEGRD